MKFPSEIFGCEKNERQSSEIPKPSSPLALTYSAVFVMLVLTIDIEIVVDKHTIF